MRPDMYEVLIERPRSGWRLKHRRGNRPEVGDWDGEDGFEDRIAPRQRRTKWFDDHLQPLRRWLRKQVNRPWDKVYAELCASIDRRSVTGQHLLDHVANEVARHCVLGADDRIRRGPADRSGRRGEVVDGLYVHPRTSLLRYVEPAWRAQRRQRRHALHRLPDGIVPMGDDRFLWRHQGLWYAVRVRVADPRGQDSVDFETPTGTWHVIDKRQLSSRELRERGLENDAQE